uniref:Uncharacterized protein n=1 Tax=viral metagenome TaxID=1070528 RepID=A0A6C0IH23_9ZZZZ
MSAPIGNTVQCGVYMVNTTTQTFPISFSGTAGDFGYINDQDDAYLVYPGFKVTVSLIAAPTDTPYTLDNTNGKSPAYWYLTASPLVNKATQWNVYYMGVEIKKIVYTISSFSTTATNTASLNSASPTAPVVPSNCVFTNTN